VRPLAFFTLRRLIIAATAIAVGYFLFAGFANALSDERIDGRKSALEAEIASLESDRAQLETLRDYLTSDEYIEKVARNQLGLVRPGEIGVVVTGPEAEDEDPLDPGRPWWKRFFD
jgi:cell division protein DivIC